MKEEIKPEKQAPKSVDAVHFREELTPPRDVSFLDVQGEVVERIAQEKKLPPFRPAKQGLLPPGLIWGVLALVLIFVAAFGYYIYLSITNDLSQSVARNIDMFKSGVQDLRNLDPQSAGEKFNGASENISSTFDNFGSQFKPLFQGAGDLVLGFRKLAASGVALTQEIVFFEKNLIPFAFNKNGPDLVAHLETVNALLGDITDQTAKLSSGASKLRGVSSRFVGDFYLPVQLDVDKIQKFLTAFIPWLKSDTPRHLLVLFQNPSEMRPAGGFLGSYADLTLYKGSIESIDVHDINDTDRKLDLKIIPPQPLQAEVSRLRAADANWFFDFSASAAEIIKLAEASKLYSTASTSTVSDASGTIEFNAPTVFDGAVAVSPKILSDILGMVGPIQLKSGHITLDQKNFLQTIQKQVQLGQAQQATYPKDVLKELAPELLTKFEALTDAQKRDLLGIGRDWIAKKDVMFYFKNEDLESFLENYDAAGTLYDLPSEFEGDYLALVDANVGSGKSDLFVKQNVMLSSQINANGTVTDHLIIDREHNGNTSADWWYKVSNQDYLQLFMPGSTEIINMKGGVQKTIFPSVNYVKAGYVADDAIALVESSTEKIFNFPNILRHKESGKQVFALWSETIKPGGKTEITLDYTRRLFLAPADGTKYQFIFEKQAGTARHYKFEISAPVGFKFKENGLPVYTYETDDIPGKLVLDLTLQKN